MVSLVVHVSGDDDAAKHLYFATEGKVAAPSIFADALGAFHVATVAHSLVICLVNIFVRYIVDPADTHIATAQAEVERYTAWLAVEVCLDYASRGKVSAIAQSEFVCSFWYGWQFECKVVLAKQHHFVALIGVEIDMAVTARNEGGIGEFPSGQRTGFEACAFICSCTAAGTACHELR